jgi:nicotinic acid mononucleotide adenylyltransferase
MGSDTVAELHLWKGFSRIQELAKVVFIHRLGHPVEQAVGPGLVLLSSTEVRQRLATQSIPEGWLPTSVANHIHTHRLYVPTGAHNGPKDTS